MNGPKWSTKVRGVAALAAVAMVLFGLGASSADDEGKKGEAIVGFWQVTFTDKDTNKVLSYVWDAWHSDRIEIQNDSGNILAGNVCQGAWVPLGHRTYGLSHPSFLFHDPAHPEFGGNTEENEGQLDDNVSCVVFERVTVDKSGNSYAGPGLTKCVAGIDPFDPTAVVVFTQNLAITGKRVAVDVGQLPSAN